MTRSVAQQMLRKALRLRREAARASEGAYEGAAAVFAVPKRLKNLEKKAAQEENMASLFTKQKGWPRGFEFGSHRLHRKFRQSDWEHAMLQWRGEREPEDGDGKLAF